MEECSIYVSCINKQYISCVHLTKSLAKAEASSASLESELRGERARSCTCTPAKMVRHAWLVALLAPSVIVAGTSIMTRRQDKLLRVLSEVVSGPALGQEVIVHVDAALPGDLLEAAMRSLRPTPH